MHLGTRDDEGQGPTRTVVWANGGETDLSPLMVMALASTICIASSVCAISPRGVPQVIVVVLAVLSGLDAAVMIVPTALVFGGIFVAKGLVAKRASFPQRASRVAAAALLGAILGSDASWMGAARIPCPATALSGGTTVASGVALTWMCTQSGAESNCTVLVTVGGDNPDAAAIRGPRLSAQRRS